jgi:sialic acid synthase SpsE
MTGDAGIIRIGARAVGAGAPCYVIAEIGSNHNQDKALALEMIDRAVEAGADAVKFQSIRFDRLHDVSRESAELREHFRAIELDESWLPDLVKRARAGGIDFLSSATYPEAVDLLASFDVPAYKLASPQVWGSPEVLRRAARTGKPLLMSMGYCEYGDIVRALSICECEGARDIVVMHCISKYPTPPQEVNLRFMHTLGAMTHRPVGLSDHSTGHHIAVAAVALGAILIEKHVTLDRTLPGPDHHFSLTFDEFSQMVAEVRDVKRALGTGARLKLLQEEYQLREQVRLKAFAAVPLREGDNIAPSSIRWQRTSADAVSLSDENILWRCRTRRDLVEGEPLCWSALVLAD